MELHHSFEINEGTERAWEVLNDIRRIAQCMPGAAVEEVDGDDVTGLCKVKLGPVALTYRGKATFTVRDALARRIVMEGQAQDGTNGRAALKVTAELLPKDDSTLVDIVTDLKITGKPAQFGRGVMSDVGGRMIAQFAANLQAQLDAERSASEEPVDTTAAETAAQPVAPAPINDELNLLAVAGPILARRALTVLVPIAGIAALAVWLISRSK